MHTKLITCTTLAALAIGSVATAQQKKQSQDEPREPRPSEIMPLAGRTILNGVTRAGEHLIAVGARGHVLRSSDGDRWHQIKVPTRAMLTRVAFFNDTIGWAVGWDGAILRTTDSGQTWDLVNFEPNWGKPYFDVLPTGPKAATVVGTNGRMLRTNDAGQNWERVESNVFATGFNFYDIAPIGDSGLIIAGERGMIARSLDGGETWQMLKPPYNGSYFGVLPTGEHGALLYGLQGEVYHAADIRKLPTLDDPMAYSPFEATQITDPEQLAKMGWRHIDNPSNENLYSGLIRGDGRLIFVGVDGVVLKGRLDSDTLEMAQSPTSAPISDVLVNAEPWVVTARDGLHHMQPLQ